MKEPRIFNIKSRFKRNIENANRIWLNKDITEETDLNIHFVNENGEGREMVASAVNQQWFTGVRGPIVVDFSVASNAGPFAGPKGLEPQLNTITYMNPWE